MPLPAPVLSIRRLFVERDQTILHDISWRVNPGEHWAILGANGSGKTTLLNTLLGYTAPTDGAITVAGETYGETDWRELRKHLGLSGPAVAGAIDGGETALETVVSGKYAMINYYDAISGRDRRLALRLLRRVGCAGLSRRRWRHLSQGERQRVLIARALMADYKILVLDEPCAGLDPVMRERFLQFLQGLGRRHRGPALLLVTHHVEEVLPCFTHVLLLRRGRVLAQGPKEKVLTSRLLSGAFEAPLMLRRSQGWYSLRLSIESSFPFPPL